MPSNFQVAFGRVRVNAMGMGGAGRNHIDEEVQVNVASGVVIGQMNAPKQEIRRVRRNDMQLTETTGLPHGSTIQLQHCRRVCW